MAALLAVPSDPMKDGRLHEIQARLRHIERRDWWLWWCALTVMMLLTVVVVILSLPRFVGTDDPFSALTLTHNVRALVGTVLLFSTYAIYQELVIKGPRRQLADQIAATIAVQTRAEEFQILATTDPLTGLYNRRQVDERLEAEVTRSRRHGQPLTVVAMDLDDFKRVNDQHGHAAGDIVLKEFARRIRKAIRGSDVAARIGGDEFLLVLPECTEAQAEALLARLSGLEADLGASKICFQFSFGCTSYIPEESRQQLLARCDAALYAQKRRGNEGL